MLNYKKNNNTNENLFSALNKLMKLFGRKDKIGFGLLIIGMIIGAGLETLSIGAIPAFISVAISPEKLIQFKPAEAVLKSLNISTSRDILIWGSFALILIFFFKTFYLCTQYFLLTRYTQNRRARLTRRLFSAYMDAPYCFHLQRNSAELMRNTLQEVDQIIKFVMQPLLILTLQGLMMLAIVALLFVSQPFIALVAITFIGLAGGGYQWWVKEKLRTHSKKAQKHRTLLVKTIQQGLGVIKELRVLRREKSFSKSLNHSLLRTIRAASYQQITNKITSPYMEFISVTGLLGIVIFLIIMGRDMEFIAPTLALFGAAFMRLKINISQIVSNINQLRFGIVSISPVYHDLMLLAREDKKSVEPNKNTKLQNLKISKGVLLQNVWYRYPNTEEYALKDISFTLPKGQSVAFVGSTGAGKTTIVDVILGLLEPEKGLVTVDGQNIYDNLAAWQRNIGYIPQFIYLIDDTIRNNVAIGLNEQDIKEEQVWQALRVAQVESFVKALPNNIDTVIGERGIRLSGGQRQRIGIARALYNNPEVLIMDEATSSLDSSTEKALVESINSLKGNRTIVMVAHRLTTVRHCDRLYFMKNGRIECFGSYQDLLMNNKEFRAMAQTA